MANRHNKPAPKAPTPDAAPPPASDAAAAAAEALAAANAGVQAAAEAWAAGLVAPSEPPAGPVPEPAAPTAPEDAAEQAADEPDDEDEARLDRWEFLLQEMPPILGETVFFRSAQSDLSGTAKAGQEVPAVITQVHSAKSVDLTVFRPNGMTPIGVVNVQNHPAGKDSPFHTSWRRPTRDDLPRS